MAEAIRDKNHVPVALGQSSADSTITLPFLIDGSTGKLQTSSTGGSTGTVTTVSVVTNQGVSGSVANPTTTPAITLTLGALTGVTSIASGPIVITSNSAGSFLVGANGATNPVFSVDSSVASQATGLSIQGVAAGTSGGTIINCISSGTNEDMTINSKGTGALSLMAAGAGTVSIGEAGVARYSMIGGTRHNFSVAASNNAAVVRYSFTGDNSVSLTASAEATDVYFTLGQTRTHAGGAGSGNITLQRDFRITGSTHAMASANTITDCAAFSIDGPDSGGTNATLTNSHGIYIPILAVTNVTNAYGITVNSSTGATNNYAARFIGQIVNGGTTPGIAAGTGAGSTPTLTIAGANAGGVITLTTGATPAASATIATITYLNPFPVGSSVVLYPANAATALLSGTSMVSVSGGTATFVMSSGTVALTTLTQYVWNYQVIGY